MAKNKYNMKKIFFIISLLCSLISSAQFNKKTPAEKFEQDLKDNKVTLYILGGIASRATDKDADFAEKYHVSYHDFGCLAPPNLNPYMDYNLLAMAYLTRQHGREWEKDIRKDILGWNRWKEKS